MMKVVKANLFNLTVEPFTKNLANLKIGWMRLFTIIRSLNGDAIIVVAGLYNPLSIVTDEANEFEEIIDDWNEAIEIRTIMDGKSCFVPVKDLFDAECEHGVSHRFLSSECKRI